MNFLRKKRFVEFFCFFYSIKRPAHTKDAGRKLLLYMAPREKLKRDLNVY